MGFLTNLLGPQLAGVLTQGGRLNPFSPTYALDVSSLGSMGGGSPINSFLGRFGGASSPSSMFGGIASGGGYPGVSGGYPALLPVLLTMLPASKRKKFIKQLASKLKGKKTAASKKLKGKKLRAKKKTSKSRKSAKSTKKT